MKKLSIGALSHALARRLIETFVLDAAVSFRYALRNAWQTRSTLIRSDIYQRTIRRLARYNRSSPVLTKVMSLTQG
ncbi:hypothetical protein WT25_01770 [Burkholderia territorii]|nr:hypothetical protein WT25_01770 [Burkholderia territorii]